MEHRSSICYEGREGGSVKGAPNPQYKGSTHKNISRQMQSDPFLLESWKKMPKIIQKMSKNARTIVPVYYSSIATDTGVGIWRHSAIDLVAMERGIIILHPSFLHQQNTRYLYPLPWP